LQKQLDVMHTTIISRNLQKLHSNWNTLKWTRWQTDTLQNPAR